MNAPLGFLPQVGPLELIIVLVILIIIFGPKRIPAAAKSIGKGFRNFKGELNGGDEPTESEQDEENKKVKTGS